MNLTIKQQKYIKKYYKTFTSEKIAKEIHVSKNLIDDYISSLNLPDTENIVKEIKKPKTIFYLILFLIPILFFVLLETGLRIFNYGIDTTEWVNVGHGKQVLNPDVTARYFFTTKNRPTSIQDVFDIVKKPNTFRVFILGESSAAGYPYMPTGAFSRYIEQRLKLMYPTKNFEIINLGITAINTYTIRDLLPGVLDQKPDLMIIYTGHNEYYGALGVGSMESLGTSRAFVNLSLFLNKFKTVELIRNLIKSTVAEFNSGSTNDGTLMSRIAKDQSISLNSKTFNAGLDQFEGNMSDILQMAKDKNVPVILSTLVSNLKDQKPFISVKDNNNPAAIDIYNKAQALYASGNYAEAKKYFIYAKDLDELRFRAPSKMNDIIKNLSSKYNCTLVDIENEFGKVSPNGIIGNNLMTDHLHLTLEGYQMMGKLFYEKIISMNFFKNLSPKLSYMNEQDKITKSVFPFTTLDSSIANYRIIFLKNDWPYVSKEQKRPFETLVNPSNISDSIAMEVVDNKSSWESAHRRLAGIYLNRNDITNFRKEMDALIFQYPLLLNYYNYVANELMKRNMFDDALIYLFGRYNIEPDEFSSKWIGSIYLSKYNYQDALKYLQESVLINNTDPQAYYNLAGAYVNNKEAIKAVEALQRCLQLEPNYPNARDLLNQIKAQLK